MKKYFFVDFIPDLTLGKYSFLAEKGVDGVLNLHNSFLRQWHEKSLLSKISIHLFYYFDSKANPSEKINLLFMVDGPEEDIRTSEKILAASPLTEYFSFKDSFVITKNGEKLKIPCTLDSFMEIKNLTEKNFSRCSMLTKEEYIQDQEDGKKYYSVSKWESNENGRLYDMFRLMKSFDEDVLYRVDLTARKRNQSLRDILCSGPIQNLNQLQNDRSGGKNYSADALVRGYEDLMKEMDESLHFSANIFVLSNSNQIGSMMLASAAAESLSEGSYRITNYSGNFRLDAFLNNEQITLYDNMDATQILEQKNGEIRSYSEDLLKTNFKTLAYLPTTFTIDNVAPFFRFPVLYDGEQIEMKKETAPPSVPANNSLYLGKDASNYDVNFPLKLLAKHAFISGVPGSGKTNTMHHLTESLHKHDIPFLVLEPAKKEYRALLNLESMKDVHLFSPNADMMFPLHINPFEMAKGTLVAEHIRTLCSVFEGAFPLDNPMPFLLDNAIEKVYKNMGWRSYMRYTGNENRHLPTMSMLYTQLEKELQSTKYDGEIKGNLESALKVRIGSLLRREMGDVFDVQTSTLAPEEWLTTPAIIEMESMGSGPANFLTLLLCALIREALKCNPTYSKDHARHVIFIEEAHNLIGPESEEKTGNEANPKTAATAFIVKMLAEVRALKESVFIADQLPTVMAQEVIKNTGLKIGLRITALDDRELLGASMSANASQIEKMATFNVGEALVSYEGLQRPFNMRIHRWCGEYDEDTINRLTTPVGNDMELLEKIKDRPVYQKIRSKSFFIEKEKIKAQYDPLLKKAKNFIDQFDQIIKENKKHTEDIDTYSAHQEKIRKDYEEGYISHERFVEKEQEYSDLIAEAKSGQAAEEAKMKAAWSAGNQKEGIDLIEKLIDAVELTKSKLQHFSSMGIQISESSEKDIESSKMAKIANYIEHILSALHNALDKICIYLKYFPEMDTDIFKIAWDFLEQNNN